MKNTFGTSISLTVFGESHGDEIGVVIDGLCPGICIDNDDISRALSRRRPSSSVDTGRREPDNFKIISGVFNGKSTGAPITITIKNEVQNSGDYDKLCGIARPSHADLAAHFKYHGYEDYRGGGHFSGRITAPIVAAGAIFEKALDMIGIHIGTHIVSCGNAKDRDFSDISSDIASLKKKSFPVLDDDAEKRITDEILNAKKDGDSIGGKVQTGIIGAVPGIGEPWFDSVEGILAHALFSIGGIKGVEFGSGFDGCKLRGSEFNDEIRYEHGSIITKTNNNGGVNGGITNGMPIIFSCAVKPTPSISIAEETINMNTLENTVINISGRHDPAIIRRICPVIDSVTALVLCDLSAQRFGTDVFTKGVKK